MCSKVVLKSMKGDMEMKKVIDNKQSFIFIPFDLIVTSDEYKNVDSTTFLVYIGLKLGCIDNFYSRLMSDLEDTISLSRRVIRPRIKELESLGFLKCRFDVFPKNKTLEIDIVDLKKDFVKVERSTVYKILDFSKKVEINVYKKPKSENDFSLLYKQSITNHKIIAEDSDKAKLLKNLKKTNTINLTDKAIRYYFFLKKNFNNDYNYSFPSFERTSKATGISSYYIPTLNALFETQGLMHIIRGSRYRTFQGWKRENNKYKLLNVETEKTEKCDT